jgi:hypothetical protein
MCEIPSFPFLNMGTRSRILIRRTSQAFIHLWMHWDGYFSGQGDEICAQLVHLLSKYSHDDLQNKVDALVVEELIEDDEEQNFSAEFLEDFVEGKTTYKNDPCDDVEYEYVIDFNRAILLAKHYRNNYVIQFESIKNGFKVSELENLDQDLAEY